VLTPRFRYASSRCRGLRPIKQEKALTFRVQAPTVKTFSHLARLMPTRKKRTNPKAPTSSKSVLHGGVLAGFEKA